MFRRAFFGGRLDALLDLGSAHAFAMAQLGGGFIELAAGKLVDGALHAADDTSWSSVVLNHEDHEDSLCACRFLEAIT